MSNAWIFTHLFTRAAAARPLTRRCKRYVTGHSNDPGQEFVFVQYKGHTLQGSYDGGFVYARKPYLPSAALDKVARVARVRVFWRVVHMIILDFFFYPFATRAHFIPV